MKIKEALSYDDVLLVPRYSKIKSRKKDVDISNILYNDYELEVNLKIPIIASCMDSIVGTRMIKAMHEAGGLAIAHRYCTIEEQVSTIEKANIPENYRAAAIGVTGDYFERAKALIDSGVKIICFDIAHGHCSSMQSALDKIRREYAIEIIIIAGNVATADGAKFLFDNGANIIRASIGGGSICSTRLQTGCGVPTFQAIKNIKKKHPEIPLIADGGIKYSGDIVKSLAIGADFAMVGSLLAGTEETPGEIFYPEEEKACPMKVYRGMASFSAQMDWRNSSSSPEGISTTVPVKGSVIEVLEDLEGGIRSGFSYCGAFNLQELRENAKFVRQTSLGKEESDTHILNRR